MKASFGLNTKKMFESIQYGESPDKIFVHQFKRFFNLILYIVTLAKKQIFHCVYMVSIILCIVVICSVLVRCM